MADLVSVPALVRDDARQRLIDEALAERAAEAERVKQMHREFLARKLSEAEQRRLARDPDAKDEEEEEEDDDDEDVEEEDEELERMHQRVIEKLKVLGARNREAEKRILDYDPKQGGLYHTRIYDVYDLASFDYEEESPLPPMRFTNVVYKSAKDFELCEAVNILSVKIASLDIDFPIHVYGTVIARDSLDKKCVYLFRRDRQNFQTINSEEESLILTGPKRGLALISSTYVETNLIIKGDQNHEDRELSKGLLEIAGMERRVLKTCELESCSLATRLSTVDVKYGVVKDAVEATISIKILAGEFFGKITACSNTIKESLVLHDSRLAHITSGEKLAPVVVPLLRSVVAVYVKDKLLLSITAHTEDGEINTEDGEITRDIDPKVNGSAQYEISVGTTTMLVEVVWSIIDF
ncbi:hypothetical protein U9M48_025412 [Paspalum notatum var. saurae]|uniref:DUF6598 domain-containing protein n=1 Tax=Paspalum notatum var. saurae TaxID=547442 RepID=A0AAQ3TPH2_PASNO